VVFHFSPLFFLIFVVAALSFPLGVPYGRAGTIASVLGVQSPFGPLMLGSAIPKVHLVGYPLGVCLSDIFNQANYRLIKNSHLKLLLFLISRSFAPPVQVAVFNQQEVQVAVFNQQDFRSSSSSGCF
jgi:hypothetical protein